MKLWNALLDIVFPTHCLSCGAEGADLCFACLSGVRGAERESADWIFPLYDYREEKIKKAVWLLKYSRKRPLATVFAQALYGRMLEELSDLGQFENFHDALLVPIPLSRKRHRERGFNQSLLMCRELAALDNGKNFKLEKHALIRTKDGVHQARIGNRSERLQNIVGAFAVKHAERIKNRNIILIDDVTTTGATLSEAKKVLKASGAKKVIAFTVAH
ncbi:MAG: ComF family protein [bacterium]